MIDNYIKCSAITPRLSLGNPMENADAIIQALHHANEQGVKIAVFPELCITGYTCGDLFLQDQLLDSSLRALKTIVDASSDMDILVAVGLPMSVKSKLFNVAALIKGGRILGIVPKTYLSGNGENERRLFVPAPSETVMIMMWGQEIPFGNRIIFHCGTLGLLAVAVEVGTDVLAINAPSASHVLNGANLILNLSAMPEIVTLERRRRNTIMEQSSRLMCGYVICSAGCGESTSNGVYAGHNLICEDGAVLAESRPFAKEDCITEIDLDKITHKRRENPMFEPEHDDGYEHVIFDYESLEETELTRKYSTLPFVPSDKQELRDRCHMIMDIQAHGLARRLQHTRSKGLVIGISGGLDSCLALIVAVKACDILGRPHSDVLAVTMPCFGTSDRTYNNAVTMCGELGVMLKHVDIRNAVMSHFADIGQDPENFDVTYENSQARERTQVLMDLANKENSLVVGTGDLSELALGWCTYNGDHMSMYGVNATVPKTLIRYVIKCYAEECGNQRLMETFMDVLDTPVSPELLPPDSQGVIAQKTEEVIGKYEINDLILYHAIRWGYRPSKVYRIARAAFAGRVDDQELKSYLQNFYRRFFAQQFKRSCLPEGPKTGSVSMSPRGDWQMPSDAMAAAWLEMLENL